MLVEKKISRYVDDVCAKLPVHLRSRARSEVSELVRDTLDDYVVGREADILDVREVLAQLGSAEDMAKAWLAAAQSAREESRTEKGRKDLGLLEVLSLDFMSRERLGKMFEFVLRLMSVIAFLLVAVGLVGVGTHVISTMLPVFAGCVIALVVSAGRGVLRRQYL